MRTYREPGWLRSGRKRGGKWAAEGAWNGSIRFLVYCDAMPALSGKECVGTLQRG